MILLVEDEVILALSEKTTLENYGYRVITALSGEEAVDTVQARPDIDLVLMDINLGRGMDGTEAAVEILNLREIPLIFMSSHTEREVVEKTEGITSYGYVVKNSGKTVLAASIRMAFRLFDAKIKEKEKEEAHQESEALFRNLTETIPLSLTIITPEGRVLYANEQAVSLLEVDSRGSLLDIPIPMVWARPVERDTWKRKLQEEGVVKNFELEIITASGKHKWLIASGLIIDYQGQPAILSIHNDITDRKETEAALEKSEAWFRTLTDTTSTAIFIYQDNSFVYANQAIETVTGYPREEFLRLRHIWDIIHPDFQDTVHTYALARQQGEAAPSHYEAPIITKAGELRWLDISAGVISWQGRSAGIGTAFDITERKLAGEQIAALLKEKELILKETHHRIKNNMGIIGSLLNLKADDVEHPGCSDVLRDAAGWARSMTVLYEKLYQAEGLPLLGMKDYLEPLIGEILEPLSAGRPVKVESDIENIPLESKTLSSLGIIINEMITNSVKYAFSDAEALHIRVKADKADGCIQITYEDNGPGFAGNRNFDQSPGFGVQLIRLLVGQLEGDIRADNENGLKYTITIHR